MLTFWTTASDDLFREVVESHLKKITARTGRELQYMKVTPDDKLYTPEKGEVVLAMGSKAMNILKKEGVVPKNLAIGTLQGKIYQYKQGQGRYMITYDPFLTQKDISKKPEIEWAITLLERYHHSGSLDAKVGEYHWVKSFMAMINRIKKQYEKTGKPVDVSLDLETMGLNPWDPSKKIVTISFTDKEGYSEVLYWLDPISKENRKRLLTQIKWLLNSKKVSLRGANLKYDLIWIRKKWGITCSNFRMDTLLVGSLLNENRSNSLSNHTKEYCPDLGGYDETMNSKYDKSKMEKIPKDDLLVYAGGDTDATLRNSNILRKELKKDKRLQRFYVNLLHPAARAFEQVEYNGLIIDTEEMKKVREEVTQCIEENEKKITDMMPRSLKLKHKDKKHLFVPTVMQDFLFTPAGLNLKPKMFTDKTKDLSPEKRVPKLSRDHIMMFEDDPEAKMFMDAYIAKGQAEKTRSTYIDGFLEHVREDGKFHPSYMLFAGSMYGDKGDDAGTNTGRLSARDPAVQTIPKHSVWAKRLRDCYTAPEGYKMWQVDFSEGELRVVACIANEANMINAYLKGHSLHAATGASLADMTIDDFMLLKKNDPDFFGKYRQRSKGVNFGMIYDQSAKGHREYARVAFGLDLSMAEATENRNVFFRTYPEMAYWHEWQKSFAYKHKYVRSPLGRVRHLPLIDSGDWSIKSQAERQAINSVVQSTLSDLCVLALTISIDTLPSNEVWIAGMTHDSIYGYVKEEKAIEHVSTIKHTMENLPLKEKFGWEPQVPFIADVELGDKFSTLEEVKV